MNGHKVDCQFIGRPRAALLLTLATIAMGLLIAAYFMPSPAEASPSVRPRVQQAEVARIASSGSNDEYIAAKESVGSHLQFAPRWSEGPAAQGRME